MGEHQCAGGYDGAFAHYGMVEQGSSHSDKGIVVYACPVKRDVVSDRHIIADFYGRFFIKRMQHAPVLDIYPVPDAYGVDISSQDRVEPDTAIVSQYDIANDCGIVGKETIVPYLRSKSSYRFD